MRQVFVTWDNTAFTSPEDEQSFLEKVPTEPSYLIRQNADRKRERETEEGNASNPIASAFNDSFLFDSVVGRDPAEQPDPINPCFEILSRLFFFFYVQSTCLGLCWILSDSLTSSRRSEMIESVFQLFIAP